MYDIDSTRKIADEKRAKAPRILFRRALMVFSFAQLILGILKSLYGVMRETCNAFARNYGYRAEPIPAHAKASATKAFSAAATSAACAAFGSASANAIPFSPKFREATAARTAKRASRGRADVGNQLNAAFIKLHTPLIKKIKRESFGFRLDNDFAYNLTNQLVFGFIV